MPFFSHYKTLLPIRDYFHIITRRCFRFTPSFLHTLFCLMRHYCWWVTLRYAMLPPCRTLFSAYTPLWLFTPLIRYMLLMLLFDIDMLAKRRHDAAVESAPAYAYWWHFFEMLCQLAAFALLIITRYLPFSTCAYAALWCWCCAMMPLCRLRLRHFDIYAAGYALIDISPPARCGAAADTCRWDTLYADATRQERKIYWCLTFRAFFAT